MNVYDIVTERILAELGKGNIPWKKPWIGGNKRAYNRVSGKSYSMLNQILLGKPGEYASFEQWVKLGARVKNGAKGRLIVFWKLQETEDKDGTKSTHPILKYYKVFHIDCVSGLEPLKQNPPNVAVPLMEAEELLHSYLARENIDFRDNLRSSAYYDPKRDFIHIPERAQFTSSEAYYEIAYHEVVHSSGHARRLNRPGIQAVSFGTEAYGHEELVAELGAAFLLHSVGIATDETVRNNAAYIQSWMTAIKADHKLFVRAASAAEKDVKFIQGT